jgi:hypothetical protein
VILLVVVRVASLRTDGDDSSVQSASFGAKRAG